MCPRKTIKDLGNLLTFVDPGKSNKWKSIGVLDTTTIIHKHEGLRATWCPKKTRRVSKETWPSLSIITHLGLKTRWVAPFQTPLLQRLDDDFNDFGRSPRTVTSLHLSSPDSPFRASHRMAVLSLTDVMTSTSVEGLLVLSFFFDGIHLKFLKDSRLRNLLIVDVWFVFAFHSAQISLWQPLLFVPYRL